MIWLGRELGDARIGVLSAGALAVMPWHIYYSRIFFPGSESLFLSLLAISLELSALRTRSALLGVAAAVAAAGSIYIYPVALVTTPLLMTAILAFRWRDLRQVNRLGIVGLLAIFGSVLLLPYALGHIASNDPIVANINAVIAAKLIWNHGLAFPDAASLFVSSWRSYLTPRFIFLSGDPNVAQSIQRMGEVGWVLGSVGLVGLVVALFRRNRSDLLLLGLTALFPIADALTYFDANGNSLRALSGSAIWALWFAIGLLEVLRISQRSFRPAVIGVAVIAVAVQTIFFVTYYFGAYSTDYAYAFETGYDRIYPTLSAHGLLKLPITFHAGYERDVMLEYFSQYRLFADTRPLACDDLPYNVVHYTVLSWVLIVREDRGFATVPGCVPQSQLIQRDETAMFNAPPLPGQGPRKLVLIAEFPNDPEGDYYTAIWYVHY
jgi:hypothetical protein